MSSHSKHLWLTAFFLLAVGLILACGVTTTAPPTAQSFDPTMAALQLQGTAMSLQMTQAVLQQPGQGIAALPTQVLTTPTETQPVYTPTATRAITLQSGAIEITDGQKLSSYPRKSPDTLYGFKGAKGDTVTILLESSNAHPNEPHCQSLAASTTFTLKTPNMDLPAKFESTHLSSMRDYVLPASGAYYVDVSCSGSGCNGNCTQADLSLEMN